MVISSLVLVRKRKYILILNIMGKNGLLMVKFMGLFNNSEAHVLVIFVTSSQSSMRHAIRVKEFNPKYRKAPGNQ